MKSFGMNGEDGNAINNEQIPMRNEKGKKFSVFDALRVLAENPKKVKDENKNHTLLEIAKRNGVT
ncbi:hypothetical protein A2U01_0089815, partial [Trifolium medium]|nr:hypothetical protein [Trifolium medium]